ncbi:MAG: hypothetical protein WCB31_10205 [Nitrososphaeraceae archaeon]
MSHYELRILKSMEGQNNNKVIGQSQPISLSASGGIKNGLSLFKKISSYVFSGFTIVFIGYLLLHMLNDYPPSEIGINP